jgi:protocatechuate 3,4-dioxygenase beta subunit
MLAGMPALFGQTAGASSIEGQVVNQVTGAPIRRASLSLRLTSPGRSTRAGAPPRDINATNDAESDEQGRFAFHNLEAGMYQITAQRQGFLGLGQGTAYYLSNSTSSQLFLGEAQQLTGYVVRLAPQAVIAGKVVDSDGDPVAGCQIAALKWGYANGVRQLTRVAISGMASTTNDLGEYRIAGVPPGSYYVAATPSQNGNAIRRVTSPSQPLPEGSQPVYLTTYHPSATESSAATAVLVAVGAELTGVDIKLAKGVTFSVRGQIIGPEESPSRPGFASLRPRGGYSGGTIYTGYQQSSSGDGAFLISGVPPGSYDLVGQRMNTVGNGAVNLAAMAILPIEVRDRNLDGISLKLLPPSDVQGVVKFPPAAQCDASGALMVALSPAGGISYGGMAQPAPVGADFKFTLKNVSASPFTVNVNNAGNCSVQSARYGGKEVSDAGVTLDGTGALEITLAAPNATVRGTVVDAAGKTPPRAYVTLTPRGGPVSAFREAFATAGGFSLPIVRAGTYDVFAWEQVNLNSARSPDFLKQFEGRGKVVTVEGDGSQTVELTVIPAAETNDSAAAMPPEPPKARGSLEGRVVQAGSDAPLKYVDVALRNMTTPPMAAFSGPNENVVTADEEGRFAFKDLEPGRYTIQATRQGFGSAAPGGITGLTPETLIVGEGQRIANYVMRLSPRSVISGKVVDEAGEPVSRVQIGVFRYVYTQGQRRMVRPGAGAQTDDRGQYRIANLAPGTYYLSATRGNELPMAGTLGVQLQMEEFMRAPVMGDTMTSFTPNSRPPAITLNGRPPMVESLPAPVAGEAAVGYAPVWYPNAAGPEAASPVAVKTGAEDSIDFTLRRGPVFRVRGQLVDPKADPTRPAAIMLSPKGSPLMIPTGRLVQARDGGFEFSGVPPGSYVLTARVPTAQQMRMAVRTVEVKDASIEGVRLEIASGRLVKGSLKVEGGGTFPAGYISLLSPEGGSARPAFLANSGNMTVPNVFPAVYAMELLGGSGSPYANYYVKSVRYGGREFPPSAIDFSGDGELDIVLSGKAATVDGSVVDAQGKPAANAAIVIAPAGGGERLITGVADEGGNFYFAGLRPGDYRVYAWDAAAPEVSDAPASLAPFQGASKAVTLAEGARQKIQVTVIGGK